VRPRDWRALGARASDRGQWPAYRPLFHPPLAAPPPALCQVCLPFGRNDSGLTAAVAATAATLNSPGGGGGGGAGAAGAAPGPGQSLALVPSFAFDGSVYTNDVAHADGALILVAPNSADLGAAQPPGGAADNRYL
jgi:hypothetical protein